MLLKFFQITEIKFYNLRIQLAKTVAISWHKFIIKLSRLALFPAFFVSAVAFFCFQ